MSGTFHELCEAALGEQRAGRPAEALRLYDQALALRPDVAELLFNSGLVLWDLRQAEAALARLDRALALKPDFLAALGNRAIVLNHLRRFEELAQTYRRMLALKPDDARLHHQLGKALRSLRRHDEALISLDRARALGLSSAALFADRANILRLLQRPGEAMADYERALALEPDNSRAYGGLVTAALTAADWPRLARMAEELKTSAAILPPSLLFGLSDDPQLQLRYASRFIRQLAPQARAPLWQNNRPAGRDRIRLAYLSADFHNHATANLMVELFERHDRGRFEVLGVSFGPDDGSAMRARLVKAFDEFLDVKALRDEDIAGALAERGVDIAIDLKGYTTDARPAILSHRPAPVQVQYLGYPGTMGADFIDYVLADATVAPFAQEACFTEKIAHLPHCYQVNSRRPAAAMPSRAAAGLPQEGLVFCAFHRHWKITQAMFALWTRLLAAAPASVLWLLEDNADSRANLVSAAMAQGIDPARLVFAPKLPLETHLARHGLADLFLDTAPCNAHTTASDALWAGVPLVTLCGHSFAGRVAASVLKAAGLSELITHSLGDYENLALALARDPARLAALRQQLLRARDTAPLFDAATTTRAIEAAYRRMIAAAGAGAESFAVS